MQTLGHVLGSPSSPRLPEGTLQTLARAWLKSGLFARHLENNKTEPGMLEQLEGGL